MYFNCSIYNIVIKETKEYIYLYNSYSGALCKLEKEVYRVISRGKLNDTYKCKYFDELYKQGFIKPVELDEFNKIQMTERFAVFSEANAITSYVVAPTLACNLDCVYCFENKHRNNKIMDDDTIVAATEYIAKRTRDNTNGVHIGWFGGEPLLAYNQIIKFSEYVKTLLQKKEIDYTASMITNGVLLTEEKSKNLSERCNIKKVQITIDGTREVYCKRKKATPQQYDKLFENVRTALKYMKVSVRLNCDGNNFEDIKTAAKDLFDFCGNNGNLSVYLAKLVDYSGCDSECYFSQTEFDSKRMKFDKFICALRNKPYKPHIIKYRKTFCGQFKLNNQVIGPYGELYQCEHHVGQPDKSIGNILYGLNYNSGFLRFIENKPLNECRKCKIFPLCLGGCPAQKNEKAKPCFYSEKYIKHLIETFMVDLET